MNEPPCELLPAALLGALDPPERRAVEEHARGCGRCRAAMGGEALAAPALALSPLAPSTGLREEILSGLDGGPPYPGFVRRFARMFRLGEARARSLLVGSADRAGWMPLAPGVLLLPFEPGPGAGGGAAMVEVEAGRAFPRHRHQGDELTLVLAGLLRDWPSGQVASFGDIVLAADGTEHSFDVPGGEACVSAVLLGGAPTFVG